MKTLRRLGIASALAVTTAASSIPVVATTTASVSGTMVFDADSSCPDPPDGYGSFTDYTVVVSGDLEGCWYTDIGHGTNLGPPSGLYFETGREVFVGSINGGPVGSFSTIYTWTSRWDPDVETGTELWGRCQHYIVRNSGTDGLRDVTGFLARTDIAPDASIGRYRGVVRQR